MHDALRAIADAKAANELRALDLALAELGRQAEALFRARVTRDLDAFVSHSNGYQVSVDEACDVLNELLWTVYQKIETYRGKTDPEARAWLQKILQRRMIDLSRKSRRRGRKWREFFDAIPERLKRYLASDDRSRED